MNRIQHVMGGRPIYLAILPLGVVAAMITGLAWNAPSREVSSTVAAVDQANATAVPTRIAATDTPIPVSEESTLEPTPTTTAVPFVYSISAVAEADSAGG